MRHSFGQKRPRIEIVPADMTIFSRTIGPAIAATLLLTGCAAALRDHIYQASATPVDVAAYTHAAPRPLPVRTTDGLDLSGYYWPGAADDRDILIFFHGRGSNQGVGARYAEHLAGQGDHVIVASYRGFAGNPGTPSEAGLIADGRAFVARARALAGPDARIFLIGHSLGGAVALHVAARETVAGVITLSTFDRLADSAPAGTGGLLPDKWDNLAALPHIHAPLLLVQGTDDQRVDAGQADALFAAAASSAILMRIPGAGHSPDMALLGPLISAAVAAIDAGEPPLPPSATPTGWIVRRK